MTIAFDLETHLFKPGYMAPRPVCLSWASSPSDSGLVVGLPCIAEWLDRYLDRELLVGHTVAFDCSCILAHIPEVAGKVWQAYQNDRITCTGVRERLLDIQQDRLRGPTGKWTYHLADLSKRRLKKTIAKGSDTWRMRYAELEGVPLEHWPEAAVAYAVTDSEVTLAVFHAQEARMLKQRYNIPTQFEDSRADFALRLATVWGIETDLERVNRVWDESCEQMDRLAGELAPTGLVQVALPSGNLFEARRPVPNVKRKMAAIHAMILKTYPGKPPRTPTGQVQATKEVIDECDSEPLQKLAEFVKLQKATNTYLAKMFAGLLHSKFYAVGSTSDRTSSDSPNLQNQPRLPGIRECFRARAGSVFLACDYDTQEMRTLAQNCLDICGRSKLAERFQADAHFDPHLELAQRLAKSVENPDLKALRQHSKIANFGFPGRKWKCISTTALAQSAVLGMEPRSFRAVDSSEVAATTTTCQTATSRPWRHTPPRRPCSRRAAVPAMSEPPGCTAPARWSSSTTRSSSRRQRKSGTRPPASSSS
jgi:DNA polymerase-1